MNTAATATAADRLRASVAPGARGAARLALLGALAAGAGILAVGETELALSLLIVVAVAMVVVRAPLATLLVVLALRASLADTVLIDIVTALAGLVALAILARRLPLPWITAPLIALLVIALPSVPLEPSFDEGTKPGGLFLPAIGLQYASDPSVELLEWLRLAAVLGIAALAACAVRSRERLELVLATIVASSVPPAIIAINQLVTGSAFAREGSDLNAVQGPFSHPNYLAFYLVVVLIVGAILLLESRSRPLKLVVVPILALDVACLFLTYTRSAWVGFALAMVLLAVLRERRLIAAFALILTLVALVVPGATSAVGERFGDVSSTPDDGDTSSWEWRTGQWERMAPRGLEQPLTGEGFGSYSRITVEEFGTTDLTYRTVLDPDDPAGSPRGFTAHNDYVKMLVELGIPGLVLWSVTLLGMVVTMLRARRSPAARGFAQGGLALAVALVAMSASDAIQAYTAVLMYSLAFFGATAGYALATGAFTGRPEREPEGAPTGTVPGESRATDPRTA